MKLLIVICLFAFTISRKRSFRKMRNPKQLLFKDILVNFLADKKSNNEYFFNNVACNKDEVEDKVNKKFSLFKCTFESDSHSYVDSVLNSEKYNPDKETTWKKGQEKVLLSLRDKYTYDNIPGFKKPIENKTKSFLLDFIGMKTNMELTTNKNQMLLKFRLENLFEVTFRANDADGYSNIISGLQILLDELQFFEEEFCVICTVEKPTEVIFPCNHLNLCKKCSTESNLKKCPACRAPIDKIVNAKLFKSIDNNTN